MKLKNVIFEGNFKGITTTNAIDVHREGNKIVLRQSKHGAEAIIILTSEDLDDIVRFSNKSK